ncbi:response regulator [cf. Phormidesmis sp. LEGE 11477]|uniref:response regulator n=1 Tax=cf. Phormidesmis sp. LEGE 11477 TaxID=1828680 RepID=UPI00188249E7|nr:response regulator [cf. Phormidesmis sp. LEGE 11477]MBE9062114.1 response regulator [cf. Phormidesmis sp. LEGE 11477]
MPPSAKPWQDNHTSSQQLIKDDNVSDDPVLEVRAVEIEKPQRLLIVDDEAAIRIILKASLELTAKWVVLAAASGEEGMSIAQAEQPDAILLDVMMPGIDGITLFHQLKAQAATQHIPVVFLTAQAREVERKQLEALGVGVILKPFEPEQIANQIRELLDWQ